jgi:SAM-dependent methyltransferase
MRTSDKVRKLYTRRSLLYQTIFVDFLGWGKELEAFFRRWKYVRPNLKIVDAGCGTGVVTKILHKIASHKGFEGVEFHAFDLTPAMLDIIRKWIVEEGARNITLKQADVLELESLPSEWREHDLVVSSAMLEYLPKEKVRHALRNLSQLLREGGTLLLFVTRRNFLTGWLGKRWWKTNVYEEGEIRKLLREVGFDKVEGKKLSSRWSKSIMVVEARKSIA